MEGQEVSKVKQLARLLAGLDQTFREDFKRNSSNGVLCSLTLAQYQVISMIADDGRCSQKKIAKDLHVTGPTVVRIVDALEKKGLVYRSRHDHDRRIVLVALTEKGKQTQRECADVHEQRLTRMMDRLPSHTIEALLGTLTALLNAARPVEEEAPAGPAVAQAAVAAAVPIGAVS